MKINCKISNICNNCDLASTPRVSVTSYIVTYIISANDVMLQHWYCVQSCGEACFDDNSTEKGRDCTGRGGFNSNQGVWGGEVSSAGTPTGQARVRTSLVNVQRRLCRLMVTEYPCSAQTTAAFRINVRKRRLNIIRLPAQTNWRSACLQSANIDGSIWGCLR